MDLNTWLTINCVINLNIGTKPAADIVGFGGWDYNPLPQGTVKGRPKFNLELYYFFRSVVMPLLTFAGNEGIDNQWAHSSIF